LEGSSPVRLRRHHTELLGRTEPEAAVVLGSAEQNDQGYLRGVSSDEQRIHQHAPDAGALMSRKDADRPHRDNRLGGDSRPARRNVADHLTLDQCGERELGNHVARRPQRLEQGYLGRDGARALRRPKTRLPKRLRVDVSNRLIIVDQLPPNAHRLIVTSHAVSRLRRGSGTTPEPPTHASTDNYEAWTACTPMPDPVERGTLDSLVELHPTLDWS